MCGSPFRMKSSCWIQDLSARFCRRTSTMRSKSKLLVQMWICLKQGRRHLAYQGGPGKCVNTHQVLNLELVSRELNHFGGIADLFRQIRGQSSRFVLFCSFWRLFTIKMIKSVKVFPFSFWKIIINFFYFYFIKFKPPA